MEDFYKKLGGAKCQELIAKSDSFWQMSALSKTRKSGQAYGTVLEGIAKEFIREFLPPRFGIKSGLVFDTANKKMSPQIDGIIYSGVPLLEFTDVVVVEKEQVRAIVEVKSWIGKPKLFGEKTGNSRDSSSGLADDFERRRVFLPSGARYMLFAFELSMESTKVEILERLKRVCNYYAVVLRHKSKIERERGKENWEYNFNNSVSELIKWLRNLS